MPARDKNVRALFTEKVIQRIERDNGCKIKMDEKFIIVSSRDQSSMTKGVDAVHKVIQDESGKGSSSSQRSRSRSPVRSPPRPQLKRSESHKSDFSPRGPPHSKFSKPERYVESHLREDIPKSSRSPQGMILLLHNCHWIKMQAQSSVLRKYDFFPPLFMLHMCPHG